MHRKVSYIFCLKISSLVLFTEHLSKNASTSTPTKPESVADTSKLSAMSVDDVDSSGLLNDDDEDTDPQVLAESVESSETKSIVEESHLGILSDFFRQCREPSAHDTNQLAAQLSVPPNLVSSSHSLAYLGRNSPTRGSVGVHSSNPIQNYSRINWWFCVQVIPSDGHPRFNRLRP